jgi:hypothetical protein
VPARPLRDEAGGHEGSSDQAELQGALPSRHAVRPESVPEIGILERPPDDLGEQHPPQHRRGSRVQSEPFGVGHDVTVARRRATRIIRTG